MVDESFHLTPLDVKRYDFGTALRGYDKQRVEQFREQVADELERLGRVSQEFESKAKGFHEQLRAFRERDKALNEALVSAQQFRSEMREQTDREAQLTLREARADAERMLEDARAEIRRLQMEMDALERTRRAYIAQLRALAQRQLTDIDAAEQAGNLYAATIASATVAPTTPAGAMHAVANPAELAEAAAEVARPSAPLRARDAEALAPLSDTDVPDTRPVPVIPADEAARAEARKSARDSRTPTWLDSSVPE